MMTFIRASKQFAFHIRLWIINCAIFSGHKVARCEALQFESLGWAKRENSFSVLQRIRAERLAGS